VFVEDEFAELMVTTALRYHRGVEIDAVKVHGMGGASPAVKVNEQHNLDPTTRFPSVCLVDGDRNDLVNPDASVFALPGDRPPEAYVFDRVLERLDNAAARLTVSMQLPSSEQDRVRAVVRERALTNRDRHTIYKQIGDDLDFTAGIIVASAFLAVWAQEYPDEVAWLVEQFAAVVPKR
jgi:hypothetical protein